MVGDVPANDSISMKKIGVADCQDINVVNIQVDFCVLFESCLGFRISEGSVIIGESRSILRSGTCMTDSQQRAFSIAPVPVVTRRKITGVSAILLPFTTTGEVDWPGFRRHVHRTFDAGLLPAVNMDTGYGNLIDDSTKKMVMGETKAIVGDGKFVAGAFVNDQLGDGFDLDAYSRGMELIESFGGIPVIFQSFGLTRQPDHQIVESYRELAVNCDQMIGFELSNVFAPFGAIYSLEVYRQLLEIKRCTGAKHSSLSRKKEWDRLALRNELRPEFKVFTGNDLAIDMVMYGSDYLLGLSTFAPDFFSKRDALWASGDARFYELNDLLQYLGCFSFRDPVPAYKHDAALFLNIRGWIASGKTHPDSPNRPLADIEVLKTIHRQLIQWEGC